MSSPRSPWALLAAALLLAALAARQWAGPGDTSAALLEGADPSPLFRPSGGRSEARHSRDLQQQGDTDAAGVEAEPLEGDSSEDEPEDGQEGEDKKETIAQILDEALKEEFKKEEEKKESVGKQFNDTVAASEGQQETVVIISSGKKKANATASSTEGGGGDGDGKADGSSSNESPAATSANKSPSGVVHDALAAAHSWVVGGTGSLGGGVAVTGAARAAAGGEGGSGGRGGGTGGGGESDADGEDGGSEGEEGETEAEAAAAQAHAKQEERKKEMDERLEAAAETDVARVIDSKDNEYVLSKPSEVGMALDPHFVKDLTVLIAASAAAGLAMGAVGQPAINGYFIAGSLVGPGGFKLIKEIVQVQSVAQLGVQLLLFTLGLEFSMAKLRAVRNVALLGGLLQTGLFAVLAGLGAKLIGTSAAQGAFVGALVAMSSTSIVIKVLGEYRTQNSQQGQITIGTLILQDCLVGLLFAFMPVLATAAGGSGFDLLILIRVMARVAGKLAVLAVGALAVSRTVLPPSTRWLARRYGADSFQLAAIAFCLLCALGTARQGLSAELGAFVAGVMLSATEQQELVVHHLEPVTQFFLALFISSTGLVLSPTFLLHHLPLLAAGASLVVLSKTILIAAVVSAFHYPAATALAVGLNLSQIGEFVFVLLSVANHQSLLADNVYLLLMGITALTLLVTPFLLQLANRIATGKAGRGGYQNGTAAGDLEMAGPGGSPGGSPSKWRPPGGDSVLKDSPVTEQQHQQQGPRQQAAHGGRQQLSVGAGRQLAAGVGPGSHLTSPAHGGTAHPLWAGLGGGGSAEIIQVPVQPGRTKLDHRAAAAHRTVQVLAHGSAGSGELPLAGGGGDAGVAF